MKKDTFLTETFYSDNIFFNKLLFEALKKMVKKANDGKEVVELIIEQDPDSQAIMLHSQITHKEGRKNRNHLKDSTSHTALHLHLFARGTAIQLSEDIGGRQINLTSFVRQVIEKLAVEIENVNFYAKKMVSKETLEAHLFNELNKFDVEYGLADDKTRVEFISNALDTVYWERLESEATAASIRKVDAKALRIAMSLNFNILGDNY